MAGYDLDVNVLILLRKECINLYLMYTKPSSRTATLSWWREMPLVMTRRAALAENLATDKATQARQVEGQVQTK